MHINDSLATASLPKLNLGNPDEGPVTRQRKRRMHMVYLCAVLLGALPYLLQLAPSWQAAGLGLLFPGAGFIAAGGWAWLLLPLTLALFAISLIAWFGAGMVTAPLLIWGGSALLAGMLTTAPVANSAPVIALMLLAVYLLNSRRKKAKTRREQLARREQRSHTLPTATAAVIQRMVPAPAADQRELDPEQLAAIRYALDLALQPLDQFEGFQTIEQFQTSARRYQLNNIGYALSVMQTAYTPNFHGYLNRAQRNVIEKNLDKRVWGYWRWERLWGHLATDFDPVGRDNIMLTGFMGLQVCLYMGSTGDMRYTEPGSLTFSWGGKQFAHDIHSIIRSIDDNYSRADFCLYPCEPGWIYTPCNFMGMKALVAYDRIFGTGYAPKHMDRFMNSLSNEFTLADGDLMALRSELTGGGVAFPFGNDAQTLFVAPLAYERAIQAWAIGRQTGVVEGTDGSIELLNLEDGVDFGRYRKSPIGTLHNMLGSAAEMGDQAVVDEIKRQLQIHGKPTIDNGVLRYDCSSTTMTSLVRCLILKQGDWQRTVTQGPDGAALKGPILAEASYPEVLVAKAFSHGEDLELVLYPGNGNGIQPLKLERLQAGRRYSVLGDVATSITANEHGEAILEVALSERTAITILPA